jgi:glucose-1-phosphate cytidylyltransferase
VHLRARTEREPLERLARGRQLMGYRRDGLFYAMEPFREYQHLDERLSSGAAPWRAGA